MLRVFYVSLFAFVLCFIIIGACDTWFTTTQHEETIKKIERRFDCRFACVPAYKNIIESVALAFGFTYEAIDKEKECIQYQHVIEVPNPEYGKLKPEFIKVIVISYLSTCGLLFYLFLFGNDWISQIGDYRVAASGLKKVHVKKDNMNAYRAMAVVLLGDEEKYEDLIPELRTGSPQRLELYFGNEFNRRLPADVGPLASYRRMEANFEFREEILEKYKIPIEIYKDSLEPVVVLSCPGYEHLEPVKINEEPTGYYSAIVPSIYTKNIRFFLKCVFYPFDFLIGRYR